MENRFKNYAKLIIKNIEGGYYNPKYHYTAAMGKSGETMFGMDRAWGGTDVNDSAAGKKFWAIIDSANKSGSWKHGYYGGSNEGTLRNLAAEIMYNRYQKYSKQYLTDKARKIVAKSPRLESHLYYGCWNGSVRFKDFANAINDAVKKGITTLKSLEQVALNSRLNYGVSLIRTGGAKMRDKIWTQLPDRNTSLAWLWWTLGIVAISGVGYYGYKHNWHTIVINKVKMIAK